jgi:hypothetical protein
MQQGIIILLLAGLFNPYSASLNDSADVLKVKISGINEDYTFSVTLKSPDTGCEQYANWWEVISPDGKLIYRRILGHSHINEQPFTRSGGPVPISEDQEVIIRAHMNNTGYGVNAIKGSVKAGFKRVELDKDFAIDLETAEPQPSDCLF